MKVSIVTPVWNDPRVEKCLDSIRNQTYNEIESIVVDGGSEHSTQEAIQKHSDFVATAVSEPDQGLYDAMNKGVSIATGEIIGILNADDRYYSPDVIESVAEAFKDESVDLVYGDLVFVDKDDRPCRYWRSGEFKRWRLRTGWVPPHPTVFVRRRVYEGLGLFDLDYRLAADYEFLLRVLTSPQLRMKYLSKIFVRMAMGGASTTGIQSVWKGNNEVRRAWKKQGLRGGWLVMVLKPLSKINQFFFKHYQAQ